MEWDRRGSCPVDKGTLNAFPTLSMLSSNFKLSNVKLKIGDKVGRLTVLDVYKINKNGKNRCYCKCKCDCGNVVDIRMDCIGTKYGKTYSCGCYRNEVNKKAKTHGKSKESEYNTWVSMKQRCLNPNAPNYPLYGGIGIKICDRWVHSFENFLEDMGSKPSKEYSLDRINVNGNYEPSNCRWATNEEQQNNKKNNVKVEFNGLSYSIKELSEKFGIKQSRIRNWRRRGLDIQERINKLNNYGRK